MAEEDDEWGSGEGLQEEVVCREGAPEWVVTFGDMMSLLLTFFILLLSFATMDTIRFKQLAGTIKQGFGIIARDRQIEIEKAEDIVQAETKVEYNARRVMEKLKRKLDPATSRLRHSTVNIQVFQSYRGVVALFPASEVFVPGTDQLRPTILPLIDYVAELAEAEGAMELLAEVRAPPDGPRAPQFQDTWELTTAQAVSLAGYLRKSETINPGRVIPVGRGSAPPTQRPGDLKPPPATDSTVEFTLISRPLVPE